MTQDDYETAELPLTSRNLGSRRENMMAITEAAISQALDAFQENSSDLDQWRQIIRLASRIRSNYDRDLEQAAFDLYELGVSLASVGYPRGEEFQELVRVYRGRSSANSPIMKANRTRSAAYDFIRIEAIQLAQTIFASDEEREYRSGEVVRLVRQELEALYSEEPFVKLIPKEEKIKEYIKDVIPEYAKKSGRPRK